MGIFNRLSDIVNSNLNSLMDRAEDPEKMIRLAIQEMEETLVEVRSTAASILAQRKEVQRNIRRKQLAIQDWETKAELALSKDQETLARAALLEKAKASKALTTMQEECVRLDEAYDKLEHDIGALENKLSDALSRRKALETRARALEAHCQLVANIDTSKLDEALERFAVFERKIDYLEAQAESHSLGQNKSIAQQIDALAEDEQIETELRLLKQKMRA